MLLPSVLLRPNGSLPPSTTVLLTLLPLPVLGGGLPTELELEARVSSCSSVCAAWQQGAPRPSTCDNCQPLDRRAQEHCLLVHPL